MEKRCDNCGVNNSPEGVPYIVHESAMARAERTQKRLVWIIILLVVLLVGSNACWLWYESQFETVIETTETITTTYEDVEQITDESGNNVIGGDINGKTESRQDNGY